MIRMKPKKNKTFIPYDPLKAKGYAERVKALLVERGTINIDISQVCDEAKEDRETGRESLQHRKV